MSVSAELHRNYIAGEWLAGTDAAKNINPSDTSDVVGEYARGDGKQAETAIAAAQAAFPAWSMSNVQERANLLDGIGNEILARKDELGRLLSREEGKTLPEGIGEVARAGPDLQVLRAAKACAFRARNIPSVRPGVDVEMTREPVGVVGLITPWNFPIAIPAWKIAPALAYGNCVVFKPADLVPGCAWALAEIIVKCRPSRRRVQPGDGTRQRRRRGLGQSSSAWTRISFTGSVGTGHAIAAQGDRSAWPSATRDGRQESAGRPGRRGSRQAVELAVNGAFFSTGQRCTASSRLIVTAGIHDRFVAAVD